MSDYKTNIFDAATSRTEDLIEQADEGFDCLDVEVWRRDGFDDLVRVEFVLGIGGPTDSILVDEHDHVYYRHSWGIDRDGNDLHEIRLNDDQAEQWVSLAEAYRDR